MIDFTLGDDLELVIDTARRFAADRLAPMQREFEAARALPVVLHDEARDIGFDRVDWPESCGGAGLGVQARVRVLEELAAGCTGAALALQPVGSVAQALLAFGGEPALAAQLGTLDIAGGARALLVFDARGALKSDAAGRINGRLPWLPAERIDLLAILDREGLRLVREGLALAPVPGSGLRAAGASEVVLQNAGVSARWRDPAAAAQALAHARLHVTALLVGQMRAAADYARRYALERVAFGKPIAHHQALSFLIVDMHAAVEMARQLLHEAAWRLERQDAASACVACAGAWIEAVESATYIGGNAVQILGGPGFMRDYPVEKYLRELRALGLLLGGADAARDDAVGDVGAGAMPAYLATAAN